MRESRKRAMIFLVLLLSIFLPTYSSTPFAQQEMMLVLRAVFEQTATAYLGLSPIIHVTILVLLVALHRWGQQVGRLADAFFGILFIFLAFSNHIALTENYGLVVLTGNLVPISVVGVFWLHEALSPQNIYVFERHPLWRYWLLPFALLAFWSPITPDLRPDFNPLLLLTSSFGVMYCTTTPVVTAILTLIYPRVNKTLLGVTSFVGFLIGLFNAIALFMMPGYTLWNFILHTPLIVISGYGLVLPRIMKAPYQ